MKQNPIYNIFLKPEVAEAYDNFYKDETGQKIDQIEQRLLNKHLEKLNKKEMLELGCGTGHWTRFFCEKGFRVTAVDTSDSMLEIAEKNKPANCKFLKADATNLPFSSNSFSVIAAVTMLEFVNDITKVLAEIDRVLKPGGTLILGCLNANSELGKSKHQDPVFQHARFFSPEQIELLLKHFGDPYLNYGVFFSPEFELMDGTKKQMNTEPAFIAASVKKEEK